MTDAKQLWLLAGGNGAGKSTFYRCFLEKAGLQFINADLIAKQIDKSNPEEKSYEAAAIAEKLRSMLLKQGASFCFETVFSHPSKIDFVAEAKSLGYEIILVYVHLETAELNLARVSQRVSEGGHAVPDDKVLARIPRTVHNIRTVLPLVDRAQFYDNSSQQLPFKGVASLFNGNIEEQVHSLPECAKLILADYF